VQDQVTVTDLRRPTSNTTVVQVVSGTPLALSAALIDTRSLSIDWSPPRQPHLHFGVSYIEQTELNPLRTFSAQDVIDSEDALPGRVIRLPPTSEDLASGQPGAIAQVHVTPLTSGELTTKSVDFSAQWLNATTPVGNLTDS
jgi:hypothetical protein